MANQNSISPTIDEDDDYHRVSLQDGFHWRWVWMAFGLNIAVEVVALGVLPFVVSTYDPQGLPGLLISAAVWFVVAIVVAIMSPGKTVLEPGLGAMLAVGPTVAYLVTITPEGLNASTMSYVVTGILGVMTAMLGAFIGEGGIRPST